MFIKNMNEYVIGILLPVAIFGLLGFLVYWLFVASMSLFCRYLQKTDGKAYAFLLMQAYITSALIAFVMLILLFGAAVVALT